MTNKSVKFAGKICIAMCTLASFVSPTLALTFDDVPPSHTFFTYINEITTKGIASGYSDGTFRPDINVTRGQMSKLIVKGFNFQEDTSCSGFNDVPSTNTFYSYIMTLKCKGVISGYSDGSFKPDETVSRGGAAKFIVEAIRSYGNSTSPLPVDYTQKFSDVPHTHTFFTYIMMAEQAKIVSGYSDGTYKPDQPVTRGAMSKMVMNSINLLNSTQTTLAEARNVQRQLDVNVIATGLSMYLADGKLPLNKSLEVTPICVYNSSIPCADLIKLDYLVPTYLSTIPKDPQYIATDGNDSGYRIVWSTNGRIIVSAPKAENGASISVTR